MQRYRERYRNEFCQFGRAAGWKGAAGAGQRKAGTGGADSGKGMEWFFVPASGNGFSKYSDKVVFIGRNRPPPLSFARYPLLPPTPAAFPNWQNSFP